MELNNLLHSKGIEPRRVLVLRHRPTGEPDLNKILPLLAADKPDLFNAYQQAQPPTLEKTMLSASYIASFIGHEPGKALFVGLYKIGKAKPLNYDQYWQKPENIELKKLGMKGFGGIKRPSCLWFDLGLTDFYSEWKGKLIVDWPPPERSWWRRAHRNVMPVHAILEDSALDTAMKRWDELDFSWSQLAVLPKRWQARLAEWRGIYYIFDTSAGKGYVGSAYGAENLLGRWRNYAASGHGGNRLLKQRDPQHFRFTILELVAPNMEADEVIRRESTWKERLHTRHPHGLNDN
jgi:hypothetical protein